jgi:hypothetical protein
VPLSFPVQVWPTQAPLPAFPCRNAPTWPRFSSIAINLLTRMWPPYPPTKLPAPSIFTKALVIAPFEHSILMPVTLQLTIYYYMSCQWCSTSKGYYSTTISLGISLKYGINWHWSQWLCHQTSLAWWDMIEHAVTNEIPFVPFG